MAYTCCMYRAYNLCSACGAGNMPVRWVGGEALTDLSTARRVRRARNIATHRECALRSKSITARTTLKTVLTEVTWLGTKARMVPLR